MGGTRVPRGRLAHSFRPIVANLSGKVQDERSLALLAVLVLLVAAGCGGSGEKTSAAHHYHHSRDQRQQMKVGLVTDIGGLNDRGFNHLSYLGLQRAKHELGISHAVFQAKSTQDTSRISRRLRVRAMT